jgi:hypothetical protein
MGFGPNDLHFLLSSERLGFTGNAICTLGRLNLFGKQAQFTHLLKEYGKPQFLLPKHRALYFAEDVLCPLGFKVDSIDASDYEGANIIHDLNRPVPEFMRSQYDLVYDGGTLEHIYNFPIALQSAMQMVKIGGHIMLNTPANNQCGHGFYQFSPELFFRIFLPENGFELLRIYMTGPDGPHHVVDPALVRQRVTLLNSDGAMLMVHAKKISDVITSYPRQSDYITAWAEHKLEKHDGSIKSFLRRVLPRNKIEGISQILNRVRQHRAVAQWKRDSTFSNRRFYVPVTNWGIQSKEVFYDGS